MTYTKSHPALVVFLVSASIVQASCPDGIYMVSPTGSGTGCTWAAASSLDYALANAGAGNSIWVKKGTYFRGTLGPVQLERGVKLIGGFAGTESAASQSNPFLNVTTLDGRTSASTPLPQGRVVESFSDYDPLDPATAPTLRGFTIANGNWPEAYEIQTGGGGMLLDNSRARIVQCEFKNNHAAWSGAGVSVRNQSQPWFINCSFHDNGDATAGPNFDTNASPLGGGAVMIWNGTPNFVDCLFYNNVAAQAGAIYTYNAAFSIINSTFVKNRSKVTSGGAVVADHSSGAFYNCIFWDNTVPPNSGGAQIYATQSSPLLVANSNVQGGWPGTGNIDSDPFFISAPANDFRIRFTSPSRNGGNNNTISADAGDLDWDGNTSENAPFDLALKSRLVENLVDMGAYETSCAQPPVLDCNANSIPDACDILEGTSLDCNVNAVPDTCDLAADPSKDCYNQNGVPDLCEASIPKGACCIAGAACNWPETSCRCNAQIGGVWYQGKKCFQISCGGIEE